jgi:hypothetical protein
VALPDSQRGEGSGESSLLRAGAGVKRKRQWGPLWDKVREEGQCRACGSSQLLDPAHLIPRSRLGFAPGAEDPRIVVPLCRLCHQQHDHSSGLDLLPVLTLDEQAFAVELVGIAEAYQRVTGSRLVA